MATIGLSPAQLDYPAVGGSGEYEQLGVSSGASPIAGDFCFKVDNTFDVCGADPAAISYLIQEASGSVVPGETRYVLQRVRPSNVYRMNAYHSTPASAVFADSALDSAAKYGIIKATVSGAVAWCVDLEDTVSIKVNVIGRIDSGTDLYPRLQVQFLPTAVSFS